MAVEFPQITSTLAAALSALAACLSGVTAFLSYKLSRQIQEELKSDERLVSGLPSHPDVRNPVHASAVVQCTIFNKSKRKAYIDSLVVHDRNGATIDVTWSDEIDDLGNPRNPSHLVGIVDTSAIFVRRNDGKEFDYARIYVSHSFSKTPMIVVFDPYVTLD